eukprot:9161280-Ditylum_brightwellii.AAC.1
MIEGYQFNAVWLLIEEEKREKDEMEMDECWQDLGVQVETGRVKVVGVIDMANKKVDMGEEEKVEEE